MNFGETGGQGDNLSVSVIPLGKARVLPHAIAALRSGHGRGIEMA